ncbi:MAG: FAD-binding oxidoreductase [Deltaproteobacteria bacterium]|nr:FAD-binding oxidoreductase [Deltaproteobacteria bacterium]
MTAAAYDAVIAGGGVIGASCAYHLARAGQRVLVLDRAATPGAGSTGRATGGFRAQYGTAINIRLSLLARAALRTFRDDTGVDPGFAEVGYLWLASTAHELDELRRANALQLHEGLTEARIVAPDELRELAPYAVTDGLAGGAWCPTDGTLRPLDLLRGYLAAAARLGADIRWGEEVVALERTHDRIAAVVTRTARHACGFAVDAAGPWAAHVAQLAGLALPVVPLRRQVVPTAPATALPPAMPLTIWLADGFHLRVRDGRALLLLPSPGDPADPWSDAVDPAWIDRVAALARARLPALRDVPVDRAAAWAGLYEMSPDGHALLGALPACPNLYFANGSSGHGVMHAPALGLLASQLALGAAPALDVRALRPSRFDEGEPIAGSSLL